MKRRYNLPKWTKEAINKHRSDVEKYVSGELSPEDFKPRRTLRGIYEQRQDGTYMTRIRITGGVIHPEQAEPLVAVSRKYADGRLHITTRQDIQLHDVRIEDTPAIMEELEPVGLGSIGGGGNATRNVTACPHAGVRPCEVFDVTPFSAAVTEYLIGLSHGYALPRKFKIAFSGCNANCALATVNDIGFVAEQRDGRPGFALYGGGGMGGSPRVGDLLLDFLPAEDAVRAAEAGRRLFDRIGDRETRAKARLRHAVRRLGAEEFRRQYLRELEEVRSDADVPVLTEAVKQAAEEIAAHETLDENVFEETVDGVRVLRQRQRGLVSVPLPIPLGDISADDFEAIAKLAGRFSREEGVRTTQDQNLVIRSVPESDVAELASELGKLKVNPLEFHPIHAFVSCTGAATCRLGLCLSQNAARACADALAEAGVGDEVLHGLDIRFSGCPRSCGQHAMAAIGFFGGAKRMDGRAMPVYHVMLGARREADRTRFGERIGSVPARALPGFLVEMLQEFAAQRRDGESFPDYYDRLGVDHFRALAEKHATPPDLEAHPEFLCDWGREQAFVTKG